MGTIPLHHSPKPAPSLYLQCEVLIHSEQRHLGALRWCTGFTQQNYISKSLFFRYLYLLAFCFPDTDTDTDSKNVSGRIQIQIVKNVTICPDNRQTAGYLCIPTLHGQPGLSNWKTSNHKPTHLLELCTEDCISSNSFHFVSLTHLYSLPV